jgi:hypothetical protein
MEGELDIDGVDEVSQLVEPEIKLKQFPRTFKYQQ